ncbi:MAG: hypothetical protein RLZZ628_3049 [Bacteroidota bacterium]|jgi:AAA15 family ATPase/GTPase
MKYPNSTNYSSKSTIVYAKKINIFENNVNFLYLNDFLLDKKNVKKGLICEKITLFAPKYCYTMLITFRFENFLSFNAEAELSMIAGQTRFFPEQVVVGKSRHDADLLKANILYGANASGKSNVVKAIDFAHKVITEGIKNVASFNKWFRLDFDKVGQKSRFEFEIKCESKSYAYGFEILLWNKTFVSEWLYEVTKEQDKPIFERTILANGESAFTGTFKPKGESWIRYGLFQKDVLKNQLFLHELSERNTANLKNFDVFRTVFQWFKENLVLIYPDTKPANLQIIHVYSDLFPFLDTLLPFFKTGVQGVVASEVSLEQVLNELSESIKTQLFGYLQAADFKTVQLRHNNDLFLFTKGANQSIKVTLLSTQHFVKGALDPEERILFRVSDESDGTQRIFDLLPALLRATQKNTTLVIDEIDRSMHPELTHQLLDFFFKHTLNKESQLLVTTHESSLLDLNFLRRDEIWFVEKNQWGESRLYSLEEYTPRHDKEIRKAYLLGRFGAIPFIGDVVALGWTNYQNHYVKEK